MDGRKREVMARVLDGWGHPMDIIRTTQNHWLVQDRHGVREVGIKTAAALIAYPPYSLQTTELLPAYRGSSLERRVDSLLAQEAALEG